MSIQEEAGKVRLHSLAACLAAGSMVLATTVTVGAAASPTCATYCEPAFVAIQAGNILSGKVHNAAALASVLKTGAVGGATVEVAAEALSPQDIQQLEADARAGATVGVSLPVPPRSNVAVLTALHKAGVTVHATSSPALAAFLSEVTYVDPPTTAAYFGLRMGVGIVVTNKATMATLNTVMTSLLHGKRVGAVDKNGVITSPGSAEAVNMAIRAAFYHFSSTSGQTAGSLVVKTGNLYSIMMVDTIATLAERGVHVTLIVPRGTRLGALATTLENRGDQIVFTAPFTGTAVAAGGTYGLIFTGNLDYQGLSRSVQVGLVIGGPGVADLQSSLAASG